MKNLIRSSWFPYAAPFALFMAFLVLEGWKPQADWWRYAVYGAKTLSVGALILVVLRRLPSLKPSHLWPSVGLGVLGFVLWVGLESVLIHEREPGFNPGKVFEGGLVWLFLFIRVFGASVVVPIMEEIFWRGFLMRFLIAEDFEKHPLGEYKDLSFWATTAAFASVHGIHWPLAVVWGLLNGFWFVKTKNLGNAIVLHATTNLCLGIYVIATKSWFFW